MCSATAPLAQRSRPSKPLLVNDDAKFIGGDRAHPLARRFQVQHHFGYKQNRLATGERLARGLADFFPECSHPLSHDPADNLRIAACGKRAGQGDAQISGAALVGHRSWIDRQGQNDVGIADRSDLGQGSLRPW